MKCKIFAILTVLILLPFYLNSVLAQNTTCDGTTTIEDNSTGQCIPICGEGTKLVKEQCVTDTGPSELDLLILGVVAGIIVAGAGLLFTWDQRRKEQNKADLEIIQNYGNQISEITKEENNLVTKLDCSLYAERYLGILEQIAFLGKKESKKILEERVMAYFSNNFRYGMNLWLWYKSNVEKYPEYEVKKYLKYNEKQSPENNAKKPSESIINNERWKNFRDWCMNNGLREIESEELDTIIKLRLDNIQNEIANENDPKLKPDLENTQEILTHLSHLARNGVENLNEANIRWMFDTYFDSQDPLETIQTYSKGSENKILPDLMAIDYEDIPDENGLSKRDVLDLIEKYSERLGKLKENEINLTSKLDCSIYAEQYLDLLDEIASIYRNKLFPKSAIRPFENNFAYGINLLNWYYEKLLKNKEFFDPTKKITQKQLEYEEDRWVDLRWICRGGDSRKDPITAFDTSERDEKTHLQNQGKKITLPETMYQYDELPEEEGIKPDKVLELLREYSSSLIEITNKETQLRTQIDCSVYAEQYLDILEQIAYLFNSRSLVTDSSTFFENNFSYGLSLKIWYDLMVFGAKGQEGRWTEFVKYCDNFQDDDYQNKVLKAFNVKEVIPVSMLFIDELPIDLTYKQTEMNPPVNGKLNIPQIYTCWQVFYDKWYEKQKKIVEVDKKYDARQSIENTIQDFHKLWKKAQEDPEKFYKIWNNK